MITPSVNMFGIRAKLLQSGGVDIPDLMKEVLGTEQRIFKGINPDIERKRLYLYNDSIEAAILRILENNPSTEQITVGQSYLDLVTQMFKLDPMRAMQIRVGASFHPRSSLKTHLEEFSRFAQELGMHKDPAVLVRTDFLHHAQRRKLTVFEIQQCFSFEDQKQIKNSLITEVPALLQKLEAVYEDQSDASKDMLELVGQTQQERLSSQITTALRETKLGRLTRVSFSAQRNDVIAETLHGFVFQRGQRQPDQLHITYADGSEAPPFPVYVLRQRFDTEMEHLRRLPVLRMGLLSERHQELDGIVHKYWFRNQEVSTGKPRGEIDRFCYELSREIFEAIREEGIYRIAMFQTGLEAANIGFYRALTEELMFRERGKPTLEVVPYYFVEGGFVEGLPWN